MTAPPPFMAALPQSLDTLRANAAVYAAPHGTPYPGIDQGLHAGTGEAVRHAVAADGEWLDHWDFDLGGPVFPAGGFVLADLGDLPTIAGDGAGNRALIERTTRAVLGRGAVPLLLGGDDSVPIPFLAGFAEHGPLTVLQIDAHIDWRQERYGERHGFSSTMRRASEMPHVRGMVQVGLRGIGSARAAEVEDARAWGAHLVPARDLHDRGLGPALDRVEAGARVVICLDVDALDAAVMPAVAYPSPGGLSHPQILGLIEGVTAKARLVGMSLVEFVPSRDPGGAAAFLAARILWNAVGRLARASAG